MSKDRFFLPPPPFPPNIFSFLISLTFSLCLNTQFICIIFMYFLPPNIPTMLDLSFSPPPSLSLSHSFSVSKSETLHLYLNPSLSPSYLSLCQNTFVNLWPTFSANLTMFSFFFHFRCRHLIPNTTPNFLFKSSFQTFIPFLILLAPHLSFILLPKHTSP